MGGEVRIRSVHSRNSGWLTVRRGVLAAGSPIRLKVLTAVPTSESSSVDVDFATMYGTRDGNSYVVARPANGIDVNEKRTRLILHSFRGRDKQVPGGGLRDP